MSNPADATAEAVVDAMTDAAVDAAIHVPGDLLAAGAAAIEDTPGWSTGSQSTLIGASPAAHYREHAQTIAQAWSRTPDVAGTVVATAMRAAASTAGAVRAEHKISLVWTGPSTEAGHLRSTRSVLATLVANATENLVLVSFASYDVAELTAALAAATARGVKVTLILETPDDPAARSSSVPPTRSRRSKHRQLLPMAPRSPQGVLRHGSPPTRQMRDRRPVIGPDHQRQPHQRRHQRQHRTRRPNRSRTPTDKTEPTPPATNRGRHPGRDQNTDTRPPDPHEFAKAPGSWSYDLITDLDLLGVEWSGSHNKAPVTGCVSAEAGDPARPPRWLISGSLRVTHGTRRVLIQLPCWGLVGSCVEPYRVCRRVFYLSPASWTRFC